MSDLIPIDDERRRIRDLIAVATDELPAPPDRDAILARVAAREAGTEGQLPATSVEVQPAIGRRSRGRTASALAAAAVFLIVAGAAAYGLVGRNDVTEVATTAGDHIVFACADFTLVLDIDSDSILDESGLWFPNGLCRAAVDGSAFTVLSDGELDAPPLPSPDGRYVAASRVSGPTPGAVDVLDSQTGDVVASYGGGPVVWLPTTDRLITFSDGDDGWAMEVVELDGTVVERFSAEDTTPSGYEADRAATPKPVPSPDGRYIALIGDTAAANDFEHVWLVDLTDNTIGHVTPTDIVSSTVIWTPDGSLDIWTGEGVTRFDPGTDSFSMVPELFFGDFAYSPDGATAAGRVQSDDSPQSFDLGLLDVASGELRVIQADSGIRLVGRPSWSSEGDMVVMWAAEDASLPDEVSQDDPTLAALSVEQTVSTPRIAIVDVATGEIELLTIDGDPVVGLLPAWLRIGS